MRSLLILDEFTGFFSPNKYTGKLVSGIDANQIQFVTTRNGNTGFTVTKTGAATHWMIGDTEITSNSPVVALTGVPTTVTATFDDPLSVTRFIAINQNIQGWPLNLGNLLNLQRLHLTGAVLNTSLPSWIFSLVSLQLLWLDNCGLTGLLPANIEDLSALQLLYLNTNSLSGPVPWEFLPTSLTQLYLHSNQFYGAIREELNQCALLQKVRLNFNNFTAYENGAFDIPTLNEIRLQDNLKLSQVMVNGILMDFDSYGSKAVSGTINLNNTEKPSQDVIDGAIVSLTADGWTVTQEPTANIQRFVGFETGDLTEAEFNHGAVMFLSNDGASTASYEVTDEDAYEGLYSLKMTIGNTHADRAGSRYIQRWEDNLDAGEKLKSNRFYSLAMKIPVEPVLNTALSDAFVQLTQWKYQHTDASDAMWSLNLGKPSQSPNPSLLQFYWNNKRPNGLKQIQFYQSSPIAVPINSWFLLEYRIVESTVDGDYVVPNGSLEVWQGTVGNMTKIFSLTDIYTISDIDPTGRLQFGAANAYGKGITTPDPFHLFADNIVVASVSAIHVASPGVVPSRNANLWQLITQLQGTFNPTVAKSGTATTWTIDEDAFVTNSPSVVLDEDNIGAAFTDARLLFDSIGNVTQLNLQNQDIIYYEDLSRFTGLLELRLFGNASLNKSVTDILTLDTLTYLDISNTAMQGSLDTLDVLVNLEDCYINDTAVTGDASLWTDLVNIVVLDVSNTAISYGTGTAASDWINATELNFENCEWTLAELTRFIDDLYSSRASHAVGAKTLNLGGSNAVITDETVNDKIRELIQSYNWTITYNDHAIIYDLFTVPVSLGNVIGTNSVPGPGIRNGDDIDDKLTVSSNAMQWLKHTSAHANNSYIRFGQVPVNPGTSIRWRTKYITGSDNNDQYAITLKPTTVEPSYGTEMVQWRALGAGSATRFIVNSTGNAENLLSHGGIGIWEEITIVLKDSGAALYRWNGSSWTFLKELSGGNESLLYLFWSNYIDTTASSNGEMSFIRVIPTPPTGIPTPVTLNFQTNRNGTFAPTITATNATVSWDINGTLYATNTPSVALVGATVDVVIEIGNPESITQLNLSSQNITSFNMAQLQTLTALSQLRLFTNAELTQNVDGLMSISSLTYLHLGGSPVTGNFNTVSSMIPNLATLYINNTSVSADVSLWTGFNAPSVLNGSTNSNVEYGVGGGAGTWLTAIEMRFHDCGWTTAEVDRFVDDVWAARDDYVNVITISLQGANAAPSAPQQANLETLKLAPYNFIITYNTV